MVYDLCVMSLYTIFLSIKLVQFALKAPATQSDSRWVANDLSNVVVACVFQFVNFKFLACVNDFKL